MENIKKMSIAYKGKMKVLAFMADKEKIKRVQSFKIEINGNHEESDCTVTINGVSELKDVDGAPKKYSRSFLADEVVIQRMDLSGSEGFRWGGPGENAPTRECWNCRYYAEPSYNNGGIGGECHLYSPLPPGETEYEYGKGEPRKEFQDSHGTCDEWKEREHEKR
jgi:hypothetical protein